ncbi:phosphate-starvation-inducible protein PsiE [Tatumella citrea]|uniref:Protein PsiE n=1 Tax=Tatumella citrea TaxID=53336 RepID=A0A1Y0L449_TATCI|nr:phosphate-starvation-inducible PsiE family protein [Tatumella citrea]ARU92767.1 phosphate-starvation-inducible E [Tatumella citrea]ARU96805.1 phosphate-starvation-inducible E [Tatumella citrea]
MKFPGSIHSMVEKGGLVIILLSTIFASLSHVVSMVIDRHITVSDILLLFMYLEFISMTETYWKMGQLPVRMPLYIAMVGIARHLMTEPSDIRPQDIVWYSLAIVLLGVAVLIVRYGHIKFPYKKAEDEET